MKKLGAIFLYTMLSVTMAFGQETTTPVDPVANTIGLATGSKQEDIKTKIDTTNGHLVDLKGMLDQLEGYVDGLETSFATLNGKDFSTSAKQDIEIGHLSDIKDNLDSLLLTDFSTAAKQDTGNGLLTDIKGMVDQLEGYVDGLESELSTLNSKDFATSAKQDTIISNVDGIEGLITSTNTKLDTGNTSTASLDTKTPTLPRSVSGTITQGGAVDSVVFDLTTSGGKVNSVTIEGLGIWDGDIEVLGSVNGTDYVNYICVVTNQNGNSSEVNTYLTTARRYLTCNVAGLKKIKAFEGSGMVSGSADITITGSDASVNYYNPAVALSALEDDRTSAGLVGDGGAYTISSNGDWVDVACSERGMVGIQVQGTFSGTLSFLSNFVSGGNLIAPDFPVHAYPFPASSGGTPVLTITAPGRWEVPCGGMYGFKVEATAWTSGAADIYTNVSSGNRIVLADVFKLPSTAASSTKQDTQITSLQLLDDVVGTNGSAIPSKSYLFGGSDGTNQRAIKTDSSGELQVDILSITDGSGPLTVDGTVAVSNAFALDASVDGIEGLLSTSNTNTGNSATALQIIDDWDESDRAKVNPIVGQAGVAAGAGSVSALTQRTTLASDDPAVTALQIMDDWDESDRAKANIIVGQAGVTAGAGAVAANTPRVTLASDDPGVAALQIIDDPVATNGSAVVAKSFQVSGTDGTNARQVAVDSLGAILTKGGQDASVSISFNESVAAPTAAVWYLKRSWTPPASTFFRPSRTQSMVTTAGSRTFIGVGRSLGTLNTGTNAFTATGSVASPNHYSRLIGCVTTVLSAVADNITVTYTDELGNTGNATAAVTFAASSPVGNCYEFSFATTTGQQADNGVRAVTNITDSAATTGVIEVYGMNAMHDALGVANAFEMGSFDNSAVSSSDTLYILLQQAATTAQQRGATILGSISTR